MTYLFRFVCAICAEIFTPPAIRLNVKNNQNSGIRKKGSCNMPCESTSEPIMLNATMQTTAPTNRRTPSQDETRITLFIFFLYSFFVMDFYKDKAMTLSRACKDYHDVFIFVLQGTAQQFALTLGGRVWTLLGQILKTRKSLPMRGRVVDSFLN